MNKQNKSPKGIKIIAGLMLVIGLIMFILQIGFLMGTVPLEGSEGYKIASYASSIAEVIFIAPLFILAGIGLWKMKEWGLFIALFAFGARISMDVIWLPMYVMFVKAGATTYDVIWDIISICIVIFAIISVVYLWRNRRCFS